MCTREADDPQSATGLALTERALTSFARSTPLSGSSSRSKDDAAPPGRSHLNLACLWWKVAHRSFFTTFSRRETWTMLASSLARCLRKIHHMVSGYRTYRGLWDRLDNPHSNNFGMCEGKPRSFTIRRGGPCAVCGSNASMRHRMNFTPSSHPTSHPGPCVQGAAQNPACVEREAPLQTLSSAILESTKRDCRLAHLEVAKVDHGDAARHTHSEVRRVHIYLCRVQVHLFGVGRREALHDIYIML